MTAAGARAEAAAQPAEAGAEANGHLLEARRITKRFGGLVAVRDIDFTIPKGAIVSLIGPNGAGKTTFFNIIAGIIDPTAGEIEFRGRRMIARPRRTWLEPVIWVLPALILGAIATLVELAGGSEQLVLVVTVVAIALLAAMLLVAIIRPTWYMDLLVRLGIFRSARPNDVVEAGIGRTFQNIRLFQNMTALENVMVGMHARMQATMVDAIVSTPRARAEEVRAAERARELLRLVGIRGRDNELARNLPYGDQRRLELARALASDPQLLLLDEPTAGMNPSETGQMTQLVARLRRELGLTILLIEHDMGVVMGISDRVTVIDHGERIAEGPPDIVRRDPRVVEAYLGAPSG